MIAQLAWVCLACAAVPAAMFAANLRLYRPSPRRGSPGRVSVLIPARNEEQSIEAAVHSVLASRDVELECIVLDDHSTDRTAAMVSAMASEDPRVRCETSPPLPDGWCGKQHACSVLSARAKHDLLCFLDADVRLSPDALTRMVSFLEASGAALASGFPRQETRSPMEQLLIPLIHFILLGFLPISLMRASASPAYSAGCGQLMLARRDEYNAAGGHAAIRESMHDGIKLPAAFRKAGIRTDIFDATDIATCRMYTSAGAVWSGLAKNATEGIAAPAAILPFTVILLCGQVLPFVLLPWSPLRLSVAAALGLAPRLAACLRFRQPLAGAFLHPLGVVLLLSIQWYALGRRLLGKPAGWKDRTYVPASKQPG